MDVSIAWQKPSGAAAMKRGMSFANSRAFDTDRMIAMMEEIAGNIADEGNAVIVGRGAPYFLRNRQDTFRVFTYAPHDEKMRRVIAMGRRHEEAEDLVNNVDKERIAYVKHYFNADWPTRSLYHLMINTIVGDENVISTILKSMQMLESPATEMTLRGVR
jgi:cytidylate kinase